MKRLIRVAAVVAAGFGIGYASMHVPALLENHHEVGDFSAHFADHQVQVVLYGTASCSFCKNTRSYLNDRGIRYLDLDVERTAAGAAGYDSLGRGGVPLVLIGQHLIRGYRPEAFDAALADLKHEKFFEPAAAPH